MIHNHLKKLFRVVLQRFLAVSFGQTAFASFIIAAASGIFLAVSFDVRNPYDSISIILLTNPAGSFFRNLHYWSAQIFFISTIFHIIDHFFRKTEKNLTNGVWLRITLSILFLFFVMISGFILKGDFESEQAQLILQSLLQQIPFFGKQIAYSFLGNEGDYQLIYVHHIVTATIILWIVTVEHSKLFWPEVKTFIYTLVFISIAGLFFTPLPHDGKNAIVKGPWYLVGLQEVLHWMPQTQIVVIFITIFLILFYLLRNLSERSAAIVKKLFLALLFAYLILTAIGYYFRGENWELVSPLANDYTKTNDFLPLFASSEWSDSSFTDKKFKQILGRRESCIMCHQMTGLSKSHDTEVIGCYSCHLGNYFTLNKNAAHKGMILIPGNAADAKYSCGTASCHPDIIPRINNNIMSTMSGIISVNRFVFDEMQSPSEISHVKDLGFSDADSHLRNLCASCHLGNIKVELGPVNELSRGGGCNACHLNYSNESKTQLIEYLKSKNKESHLPQIHPNINLEISNDHCFGCHSRSGRISTNYEGWFETLKSPDEYENTNKYRTLLDRRVFQRAKSDIHFERGLECIDCHLAQEIMGDGISYLHKEDQLKIQCTDCHSDQTKNKIDYMNLDYESRKIVDLRNSNRVNTSFIITEKSNLPLTNSYIVASAQKFLVTKTKKDSLLLKPPAFVCINGKAHQRLSCNSCHTEWVSYCIDCHTEYNPREAGFDLLANKEINGSWIEHASDFYIEYPVLGVKKDAETGKETIETFIPGMIIKIEKMKSNWEKKIFKRLFARSFSHTINKVGRRCISCHNNSLALGYGKGELKYQIRGNRGEWKFIPSFSSLPQDNLPKDAWIGFLQTRDETSTTRTNTRPFTIEEQKKILVVGACLTCHEENSKVMKESLYNFNYLLQRISKKCVLPN